MKSAMEAVNTVKKSVELGPYFTIEQLAEALNMSMSGIGALVRRGKFPAGVKIGRARRWHIETVKAWLAEKEVRA